MKPSISAAKKVVACEVYKDPTCLLGSNFEGDHRKMLITNRVIQEALNRRFKRLFVLSHRF